MERVRNRESGLEKVSWRESERKGDRQTDRADGKRREADNQRYTIHPIRLMQGARLREIDI